MAIIAQNESILAMTAYAQIQHEKKKISFKDTQVFLRTFSRSFCGPLSQTIFQGNSEPLLSTSKSTNQPTNQENSN